MCSPKNSASAIISANVAAVSVSTESGLPAEINFVLLDSASAAAM